MHQIKMQQIFCLQLMSFDKFVIETENGVLVFYLESRFGSVV